MKKTAQGMLAGVSALLLYQQTALAEDSISFTFAPPPITSPAEEVNKLRLNMISLEMDTAMQGSSSSSTTEFTLVGLNFLTKQQGLFLSGGMVIGGDDEATSTLTGFNFNFGYEGVSDSGFGASGGLGMDLIFMDTDMSMGSSYFYNETAITTMSLSLALQQRIPLGAAAGLTPYVSVVRNLGGSGYSDTTISGYGYDSYTSTTVDVEPYTTTQFGFDLDIDGFSLAALVQETDNTSLTSLNVGFEF